MRDKWKEVIAARLNIPNVNERCFNEAWDSLTPEEQRNIDRVIPTRKFMTKLFEVTGLTENLQRPAPTLERWQAVALHCEYGNPSYKVLLTPDMAPIYRDYSAPIPPIAERRKRFQEMSSYLFPYSETTKRLVMGGYKFNDIIPYELCGEQIRDWREMLPRVQFWVDMYTEYTKPLLVDSFRGEHSFLSNFHLCSLYPYSSAEAAFQAAKCADDSERILFQSLTPSQAKKEGRRVKLRPDWDAVKVDIMLEILKDKFDRNPELKNKLMMLEGYELVEGNTWHDNFWGDCKCSRCADKPGLNMLGKLLMALRDSYLEV